MAKKPPPPPPVPQPSGGSKSKNQQRAIDKLLSNAPGLRRWMPMIRAASARWGFDPVYMLAVLSIEDGSGDPHATSSAGARGLAQILDKKVLQGLNAKQYASFISEYGDRYKNGKDQATNPVWALNYLAWRMAGQYRKYGDIDKAYVQGYHGAPYDGRSPSSYIPGWYQAQAKFPATASERVGKQVDYQVAKGQNPYLQGQLFVDKWHNEIDPIWESYTGKRASRAQAVAVIKAGWSSYHLEVSLSKSKAFVGSPIWQSKAPGYRDVYQQIYGSNAKPSDKLLAYGIIHNLDGQGFANIVRKQKNYTNSNEFKTNAAQFDDIYRKIYGTPDQTGVVTIKRAVLNGWSQDMFAKYLRGQPEYSKSQEWGSAVSGLLDTLGMITGQGVVMTPGKETGAPVSPSKAPGPDKRVPGQAGIGVQGPQYKVGLNG